MEAEILAPLTATVWWVCLAHRQADPSNSRDKDERLEDKEMKMALVESDRETVEQDPSSTSLASNKSGKLTELQRADKDVSFI